MTIELGSYTSTYACLTMPRVGAWHADVMLDTELDLLGQTLALAMDGETFLGTVIRGRGFVGGTPLRLVGGRGYLSRLLSPQNYKSPTIRTVVSDILGSEVLSATSDQGVLGSSLPAWEVIESIASHALTRLLAKVDATWRVLADGSVWIGRDSFPALSLPHVVEDEDWFSGTILISPETPGLRPGVTFLGHQIEEVVHWSTTQGLRTEARTNSTSSAFGKFFAQVQTAIDYSRRYPARVATVNGDGTVQVVPDDAKVKGSGLDKVRLRSGVPGTIKPVKGARCVLGWDAGDPSRAYASDWDNGDVEEIVLADGSAPTAHVGSTANVFFPPAIPVSGTLSGAPFTGVLTIVTPGLAVIQDGNPKVLT